MNTEIALIATILALVILEWLLEIQAVLKEKKYHREYMRSYRIKNNKKELRKLRKRRTER